MNLDKEAESMGIIRAAAHAVGGGWQISGWK